MTPRILAALGDGLTLKQLADALGESATSLSRPLTALVDAGQVVQWSERGATFYAAVEKPVRRVLTCNPVHAPKRRLTANPERAR